MEDRILQHIDDIDTRRALGLMPRKLPPSDLVFPLGKICTEKDDEIDAFVVFVYFDNVDIYFYKITYITRDHSDFCGWYFSERDRARDYDRTEIPWHRIAWPESGREYETVYDKDTNSYSVTIQGWEDNWPNLDDWTENGRVLQRHRVEGRYMNRLEDRYMIINSGYHPDWLPRR